jgi:hypothetical protein
MNSPFADLPLNHTAKELHDQALAQQALENFWAGKPAHTNVGATAQSTRNVGGPLRSVAPTRPEAKAPTPTNSAPAHTNTATSFKIFPAPTHTTIAVVSAKPHHPVREVVGAGALFIGCVLFLLTIEFVRALFRPIPLPAPPAVKQLPALPPAK